MEKTRRLTGFEDVEILSREELLKLLSELIFKIKNKIFYGRFSKPEVERMRIKYDRLFIEVLNTYNNILKDKELEEIKERLERLEERMGE